MSPHLYIHYIAFEVGQNNRLMKILAYHFPQAQLMCGQLFSQPQQTF